jgi:eukaryotic-like serine/threonine-protein kinase
MLFTRARLHQVANHRGGYRKDFGKGISTAPKVVDDWIARALAQLPRYPDRAKADLQAALRIDPKSLAALQNLAYVESEHHHDTEAAMLALDRILEYSPENEAARAGRSVLFARLERIEECRQDLSLLSKRKQKLFPSTLYQMGCAHALISTQIAESAEVAVRLLAQAIRRGYGADVIETDPDLDAVREHESFAALMTIAKFYRAN